MIGLPSHESLRRKEHYRERTGRTTREERLSQSTSALFYRVTGPCSTRMRGKTKRGEKSWACAQGYCKRGSDQARKTNPNLNFQARRFSGGVGVFHTKGWGPKSSVCPSKPGNQTFGRDIPGFCWDIPGAPEKLEKKKFGFKFRSLSEGQRILDKFSREVLNGVGADGGSE